MLNRVLGARWVALVLLAFVAVVLFPLINIEWRERDSLLRSQRQLVATGTNENHARGMPNFIIIVADDLSWNSLGFSAQSSDEEIEFATPILSNMATKGLIMDQFYSQEVCSPARAALLTGRYPLTVGMQYGMVAANAYWGLDLEEVLLPAVLQQNGYSTHAIGKWHLGYFDPQYLPTARGFDSFVGYLNGETYYWSKRSTDYSDHTDLMESDQYCFAPYQRPDMLNYSTFLYRDRAIDVINAHNQSNPLFLYLAFQAVHDPFSDLADDSAFAQYVDGVPIDYLGTSVAAQINNKITGLQRQQYVASLSLMDSAIGDITDTLESRNMSDNTYIIFLSDNGGCHEAGGRNGPLRGSKGSLFEGGVRVTSFIYAPGLLRASGKYSNLMHVSDWFPTILELAGIDYDPDANHTLDGVDHMTTWFSVDGGVNSSPPRSDMLYNMYVDLTDYNFDIWTNGSFAVRDHRFKLMHTYEDPDYSVWHMPTVYEDGDDDIGEGNRCAQQFLKGEFKYWLFDLTEDPYEYTNLYDSPYRTHVHAKKKLYAMLDDYRARARRKISIVWDENVEETWAALGNRIMPFAPNATQSGELEGGDDGSAGNVPRYCEGFSLEN